MKKILYLISFIFLFNIKMFAYIENDFPIQLSFDDTFIIHPNSEWNINVQKIVTWRFADINIIPKKGDNFNMQLYFKCDTPDLAKFDTPEKMKRSILIYSEQYLPYIVKNKITLKSLNVRGLYGFYTVITDKDLINKKHINKGEFKYITRGMVRLSKDSVLGFSLMTNNITNSKYKNLMNYILHFVKERQNLEVNS